MYLLVIAYRDAGGNARVEQFTPEEYVAAEAMVTFFPQTFPGCTLVSAVIVPRQL